MFYWSWSNVYDIKNVTTISRKLFKYWSDYVVLNNFYAQKTEDPTSNIRYIAFKHKKENTKIDNKNTGNDILNNAYTHNNDDPTSNTRYVSITRENENIKIETKNTGNGFFEFDIDKNDSFEDITTYKTKKMFIRSSIKLYSNAWKEILPALSMYLSKSKKLIKIKDPNGPPWVLYVILINELPI
jgi:hypothetical protein